MIDMPEIAAFIGEAFDFWIAVAAILRVLTFGVLAASSWVSSFRSLALYINATPEMPNSTRAAPTSSRARRTPDVERVPSILPSPRRRLSSYADALRSHPTSWWPDPPVRAVVLDCQASTSSTPDPRNCAVRGAGALNRSPSPGSCQTSVMEIYAPFRVLSCNVHEPAGIEPWTRLPIGASQAEDCVVPSRGPTPARAGIRDARRTRSLLSRTFARSRSRKPAREEFRRLYTDKVLSCADCGQEFAFTASEQEFYAQRQFSDPRRCPSCRASRKAARGDTGGGSSYGAAATATRQRWLVVRWLERYGASRGPREMFAATCSSCGREAQVPFRPTNGKPVYCNDCFASRRA